MQIFFFAWVFTRFSFSSYINTAVEIKDKYNKKREGARFPEFPMEINMQMKTETNKSGNYKIAINTGGIQIKK